MARLETAMRITANNELSPSQLDEARRIAWMHDKNPEMADSRHERLGTGHYSTVYHLDNELVVKVGGTAGYGHIRNKSVGPRRSHYPSFFVESLGREKAYDPWPVYLDWVGNMRRLPTWAPRVYHFEWLRENRGVYFAVIERLQSSDSEITCGSISIKPLLKHAAIRRGFILDLHADNVMTRPGYSTQVITDPWCSEIPDF